MNGSYKKMWGLLAGMVVVALVVAFGVTSFIQPANAQARPALIAANASPANSNVNNISNNNGSNSTGNANSPGSQRFNGTNSNPPQPPQGSANGFGRNGGFRGGGSNGIQLNSPQVAAALGISQQQLNSELTSGKSLGQIASIHSVAIQTVKDALLTNFKSQLDTQVKNGQLSQPQADTLYQRTLNGLDKLLNRPTFGRNG